MNYLLAILLSFQVDNNLLAETSQPTLAPPCQCQSGDAECTCEVCDCAPKQTKPVITVVRKPRIDEFSPITLAPDPDYSDLEAEIERENSIPRKRGPSNEPFMSNFRRDEDAFVERWKNPNLKTWTGTTLPPDHLHDAAAVEQSPPRTTIAQPPSKAKLLPIERAAMVRVYTGSVCVGGVCTPQYEYRPASQAPTKSVQPVQRTYQRRGIFGLRRR